ncbi:hypothetical protein [Lacinutrix sp. MEBiC02404]
MKKIDWNLLNETIFWWEKKRIIFNIAVGLSGVLSLIVVSPYFFGIIEIMGILIWAILANILYSSGILIEIINLYYYSSTVKFFKYRFGFYVFGLLLYCAVTFFYPFLYFFPTFD